MDPAQIRAAIAAITADDKHLLEQNIHLITETQSKEDLSAFMSFIDPLSFAVAVDVPHLCAKVCENFSLLTPEQIRVVIPLLNTAQVCDCISQLEHENQVIFFQKLVSLPSSIVEHGFRYDF
jgi:hypothetical protein